MASTICTNSSRETALRKPPIPERGYEGMLNHPANALNTLAPSPTPAQPRSAVEKIFCIGLGRTGTTTFSECMQRLGRRHLGWARGDGGLRRDLGLLAMIDYEAFICFIDRFESVDDYPCPLLYRQLADTYPTARFVLTTRISAARWADSIIKEFNRKKMNEGDNTWYEGDLYAADRRTRLVGRYESHLTEVRNFFAGSGRFLEVCWERGEGWQKLCGFLGCAVPSEPFPHVNKSQAMSPLEAIRSMIDTNRHGKLRLFLDDQQEESHIAAASQILTARLQRSIDRSGNSQRRKA